MAVRARGGDRRARPSGLEALREWWRRCEPRSRWTVEALAGITDLSLDSRTHRADGLHLLAAMPKLERLTLSGSYPASALDALATLTGIERLTLTCPKIGADAFAALAGWRSLRALDLNAMTLRGGGIAALARVGVATLGLAHCTLDGEAVAALAALPTLRSLDLALSSIKAAPARIGELAALPALTVIRTPIGGRLDDDDLIALATARTLRSVSCGGQGLTDRGVAALASLPRLTDLDLGVAPQVTDAGLRALVSRSTLQRLRIAAARGVTGAFLAGLGRRPGLRELALAGCGLRDACLSPLARARALEWLDLSRTPIGDAALAWLPDAPLRFVDLSATRVTEVGLARLPPDLLARITMVDNAEILRRGLERQADAVAGEARDYLALRIRGTIGHAHVDETLVLDEVDRFVGELRRRFERPAGDDDLVADLAIVVLVYRGGRLRRQIDLVTALRLHAVDDDGALGRAAKLAEIHADADRRARIAGEMNAGRRYVLRLRVEDLRLPDDLTASGDEAATFAVPIDAREATEQMVVCRGWS